MRELSREHDRRQRTGTSGAGRSATAARQPPPCGIYFVDRLGGPARRGLAPVVAGGSEASSLDLAAALRAGDAGAPALLRSAISQPARYQFQARRGQPGDVHEREADRAADQLMRSADPENAQSPKRPFAALASRMAPAGQPLPEPLRAFFEPRFGFDFAGVRLHTGDGAARIAGSLEANAVTRGSDIFFAAGQYRPETVAGRHLLAHELAHVVQQHGGSAGGAIALSPLQGIVAPMENADLIFAGEHLCHLPTGQAARRSAPAQKWPVQSMPNEQPPRPLTDAEKKQLTLDLLKRNHNLSGEHLHILMKVYEIIHVAETVVTLGEIAGLIKHASAAARLGSGLSIAAAVLLPVVLGTELINAWQTGQRMYGMRAVAYTTTAWAFGETPPTQSQVIIRRIASWTPQEVRDYQQAWREASGATIRNLDSEPGKRNVSKQSFQALLRALGDNQRSKLCLLMLQGFEKKLGTSIRLDVWKDNYKVEYPQ